MYLPKRNRNAVMDKIHARNEEKDEIWGLSTTCLCKACLRGSLGERDLLLSRDGSRLRSSEVQRDTSGDRRWRRSLDRPLS